MPLLCKQEGKRQTSVQRRLRRTHAVFGTTIPEGWVPMSGMKVRSLVVLSNHSALYRWSVQSAALLLSDELMNCCAPGTNGYLDLRRRVHSPAVDRWSLSEAGTRAPWHGLLQTMWLPSFAMKLSRLDACDDRKVVCWCRTQAASRNSQGFVGGSISEVGVSTTAPDRSAVHSSWKGLE